MSTCQTKTNRWQKTEPILRNVPVSHQPCLPPAIQSKAPVPQKCCTHVKNACYQIRILYFLRPYSIDHGSGQHYLDRYRLRNRRLPTKPMAACRQAVVAQAFGTLRPRRLSVHVRFLHLQPTTATNYAAMYASAQQRRAGTARMRDSRARQRGVRRKLRGGQTQGGRNNGAQGSKLIFDISTPVGKQSHV